MKKIKIIKKKEILLVIIAVFFLVIGFISYNPILQENNTVKETSDSENYPETNLGETTLVSSNSIDETDNKILIDNEIAKVTEEKNDFFIEERMKRESIYSENLETYNRMLENTNISSEQKVIAQNEITNITNEKSSISIAENLIRLKGFEDVLILKNGEKINVIIRSDILDNKQVAQIQNIVEKEFETESKNIIITTK